MGVWQFGSVRRREVPRRVLLAPVDENQQHRRAEVVLRLRRRQRQQHFPGAATAWWLRRGNSDRIASPARTLTAIGDRQLGQLPNAFDGFGPSGSTPGYGNSSASRCAANSVSHAPSARSSSLSSVERGNVAPSPVPWTSTSVPVSVATTFMSTSARESSSYGRSTRTLPSTTPTLTAAMAHDSGRGSDSL